MITKEELQKLLTTAETFRVERTVSTTDKDKFGEAVCAFANDMPDTGKPGYLLIGVRNDGSLNGLKATDELLQKFAALRSDGNILPIPSISVDSFSFPDGDVIVVEVLPSLQPPVRYRGRTWIRNGPRRDIATLDEETMLAERKARHFASFDARPCFGTTIDDLHLDLFEKVYLPKAVDAGALAVDNRPVERKLESLRFYNSAYGVPTNAAIILFGKDPRKFFPGAFVQYVEFAGEDKASGVVNEMAFKECLVLSLPRIEPFLEATVVRKYPVKVSAMREETLTTYPKWAIRELAMNAIMHRDYQGNAPVRIYQFANSLEILNHGFLYGRARPENFPNISDYRNPVIAEAMKVLGYVNAYNLGIAEVQRRLAANGNAPAEFDFSLVTAFGVSVKRVDETAFALRFAMSSHDSDQTPKLMTSETVNDPINSVGDPINRPGDPINRPDDPINESGDPIKTSFTDQVLGLVKENPGINRQILAKETGKSVETIKRAVALLIASSDIEHRGSKKSGGYYPKNVE